MDSELRHSFLRWAGSKRQLLPVLSSRWQPSYRRYVEPFAGSACLFFRLQPTRALLGDVNTQLIDTYRTVAADPVAVADELNRFGAGRREYLRVRAADSSIMPAAQKAARFIYLNRFCFNGLYRTNRRGQFNVPFGGGRSGSLPSLAVLSQASRALLRCELVAGDFDAVLKKVRAGDFVYMDPPFAVRARRVFAEYDASVFDDDSLMRLRLWLDRLAAMGVAFVLSYAESEEARFLADGFGVQTVAVRRNVGGFAARRGDAREMLISNQI